MAGKAYSMSEMRDLVGYLVEKGAYGEIRARTMWKDFAGSGRTKRTWQSLKETFLKRILPDIHNPYYKLTPEQIQSFRSGKNVTKDNFNKLTSTDRGESSRMSDAERNPDQIDEQKYQLPEGTGELPQASGGDRRRSERSSEDTVVLDTSEKFADAEEVISSLQAEESFTSGKRLKDMIVYTDPLTPMMQEIIGDWESDSSSKHSDSEPNKRNTENDVAPTASSDTFLPNNQEAMLGKPTDSQASLGKNTQALEPLKTRSQANNSDVSKTSTQVSDSILKNVLNKKSNKNMSGQEPIKKKVRLSEDTITSNASEKNVDGESTVFAGTAPRTRSKKNITQEKVGDFSTTADLLTVLTDSILPNNQEGIRAIRKFLDPQASNASDDQTKSDTQLFESSRQKRTRNKKNAVDYKSDTQLEKSRPIVKTRNTKKNSTDRIGVEENSEQKNGMQPTNKKIVAQHSSLQITEPQSQTENHEQKSQKTASKKHSTEDSSTDTVINTVEALSVSNKNENGRNSLTPSPIIGRKGRKNASPKPESNQTVFNGSPKANSSTDTVINTGERLSVSDNNEKPRYSRTPSPNIVRKGRKIASPKPETAQRVLNGSPKAKSARKDSLPKPGPSKESDLQNGATESEKLTENCTEPIINIKSSSDVNTESYTINTEDTDLGKLPPKCAETIEITKSIVNVEVEKDVALPESNPCLQSVSLYEEAESVEKEKASQLDGEADKVDQVVRPTETAKDKHVKEGNESTDNCSEPEKHTEKRDELIRLEPLKTLRSSGVVLLSSHSSESESVTMSTSPPPRKARRGRGKGVARALPKLFGFADGHIRGRHSRKRGREHSVSISSDSEWSADSMEDAVPLPRPTHRHLYMRRPAEGRVQVLSDGSLVALCGGRVYSLVTQRGRRVYTHRYARPHSPSPGAGKESTDEKAMPAPRPHRSTPATTNTVNTAHTENRDIDDRTPSETAPGAPQTCVVLTKDKITFSGDVERILSVLPRLQQAMRGLEGAAPGAEGATPAVEAAGASLLPPRQESSVSVDECAVRDRVAAMEEEIFKRIAEVEERGEGAAETEPSPREPPVKQIRITKKRQLSESSSSKDIKRAPRTKKPTKAVEIPETQTVDITEELSEPHPTEETTRGKSHPLEETSGKPHPSEETTRSKRKPSEETTRGKQQLSEETTKGKRRPSEETTRGKRKPSEETTRGKRRPSEETTRGKRQPSEETTRGKRQPSEETTRGKPQPPGESRGKPQLPEETTRGKRQPSEETTMGKPLPPEETTRGSSDSEREIIIQEERTETRRRRAARDTKMAGASPAAAAAAAGGEPEDEEPRYALPPAAQPHKHNLKAKPLKRPYAKRKIANKENEDSPTESTQGYQDSDASPFNWNRRRRFSHQMELVGRRSNSLQRFKRRSHDGRRRSSILRLHNPLPQTSSESEGPEISSRSKEQETQTSPHRAEIVTDSEVSLRLTPEPDSVGSRDVTLPGLDDPARGNTRDLGNSSNVSLPPSPELSIVERISVRARSLSRYGSQFRTINEHMEQNESTKDHCKVSIISDFNYTCPLMEQEPAFANEMENRSRPECGYQQTFEDMEVCATTVEEMVMSGNATHLKQKNQETITDSLISRVTGVNINDTHSSESMQAGLNELQLDSFTTNSVQVNVPIRKSTLKVQKVESRAMKRCSTPNKRKKIRKAQAPTVSSVAEEELMQHTEYCIQKRRKSCPAFLSLERTSTTKSELMTMIMAYNEKSTLANIPRVIVTSMEPIDTVTQRKPRQPRKPKPNTIKVKILRPKKSMEMQEEPKRKNKRSSKGEKPERRSTKSYEDRPSTIVVAAQDSCITIGSSTELIHNHSDSCLAQQCVDYSAAGREGSEEGEAMQRLELTPSPDCFSSDARDSTAHSESAQSEESASTAVLRLSGPCSLTEDATPSTSSSWYLLSEEEDSGSWEDSPRGEEELRARYGAHISSLYPLVSAVPHLSTITEASCDTQSRGAPSCDGKGARAPLASSEDDFVTCSGSTQYSGKVS